MPGVGMGDVDKGGGGERWEGVWPDFDCVWGYVGQLATGTMDLLGGMWGSQLQELWTHWDLNPGPSACEADVIPLHHVPLR